MNSSDIKTLGICALLLAGLAFLTEATLYLALIAFVIMLFLPKGREFLTSLGFRRQDNWFKTIGLAIAGYAAVMGAQTIAANLLPEMFADEKTSFFADIEGNIGLYAYSVISGIVIGGFVEEMLFRGFLLTRLTKIFGNSNFVAIAIAIVTVTSLIFAFIHLYQSPAAAILTGIFSFIAGMIFIKTRFNLWLVIILHSIFNIVSFTVMYLGIG